MQKRYYKARYPLLPMGGIGKFLRVWVRLGNSNKPHAKSGTYHASVFGFQLVCGYDVLVTFPSLWQLG